ncbi:MAG: tRNA (adenosine(37)-N6)-threonylcarbamoyltransferase complex dimerization subunit type 1 TsaB [Sphaerochaetaceae bacterium]|jgi:tRNA threonylcarbamoyladenosine biosynthesis protein TsaB|nr:tRNA (adenosine(37)-N6)-threonylcarbamoyltransferase complex dimerization subunit type 1 TsaB [Sphaerochaetaceae bacterium]MDD3162637.1 tRNA (adenosine(37)-N6)-threonylcarbamoyltransferase complex dimerization subunit type 1 TsaB [Sphaerochaetaceae bacterium]MDD4007610.1 tRNA (adenosine(37)-N6)-threonylcarbamoyltransferase complex dimerization subunit type 1 TsaB [Sphaerochaetaceae bacterium]MDD4396763.1 tRNA (adenosine(37)-N6)-threonylcarbamoyltransferase complex dimerization subunit type 1 
MNTLSVCTFDETLEIAVSMDSQFSIRMNRTGLKHSESLMPSIMQMLSESGLSLKDLDLLVCTRGPGSFTGLRIGMAALKGIAFACDKPLASVSTMDVIAWNMQDFDGAVVPLLDARKQRYYSAAFKGGKRIAPDMDSIPEDLVAYLKDQDRILFTGSTARPFAMDVEKLGVLKAQFFIDDRIRSYSQALTELGIAQFNEKGPDDIGQGPAYLRKSEAEAALEARTREENPNG